MRLCRSLFPLCTLFLFQNILNSHKTKPNWSKDYNITKVPTTLCLSQMKQISGSHYFLHLFPNSASKHLRFSALPLCIVFPFLMTNALCEYKFVFCLVLRRVYEGRINTSILQNLKFDWSIQVTWKRRVIGKSDSFEQAQIFAGIARRKLTNTPAVIFSYTCRGRWFIFMKLIIIVIF